MKVRILYFARLRETLGIDEETIEIPEGARVETLLGILKNRHQALNRFRLLVAVNAEYASPNRGLREGDVIALFPPVSGG